MTDEGRRLSRILVVLGVLAVLAIAAWHWGRPAYRHLKEKREAAAAKQFFARADYRNALISARLALMLNSNNVAACGVMADLAALSHSPATLDWRQRVAELDPTVDNKLALASSALEFQTPPFPLASQILNDLAGTATNLTAYHSVATALALRMNNLPEAEHHLEAAERLDPTNKTFQLNLAVLQLNSTNLAVAEAARSALEKFRDDTNLGPSALRSLVSERILHKDFPAARDYSTQLLASADANLNDRLQYLGILKNLESADLAAKLAALQQRVATNAVEAAQTASWMEANGFMDETTNWVASLPADVQAQVPVQLALVDYYVGTTNWLGLRQLTGKGDWGDMDFLRLAFFSRAWDQLGEPVVAQAQWHSAVAAAGDQLGALNTLLGLAGHWDKKMAQQELLERIIKRFPDAQWARQGLAQLYLDAGDTQNLYELYSGELSRLPQNLAVKNNVAATALLLKTNLSQAFEWAAEVHAQRTNDPVIVSTYAYALHLQGKDHEALAAFQPFQPSQLEDPSVALYYGILLAENGERERASHFLSIAAKDTHLLPEEKKLLAQAEQAKAASQ